VGRHTRCSELMPIFSSRKVPLGDSDVDVAFRFLPKQGMCKPQIHSHVLISLKAEFVIYPWASFINSIDRVKLTCHPCIPACYKMKKQMGIGCRVRLLLVSHFQSVMYKITRYSQPIKNCCTVLCDAHVHCNSCVRWLLRVVSFDKGPLIVSGA
jgi:hypothetical protein